MGECIGCLMVVIGMGKGDRPQVTGELRKPSVKKGDKYIRGEKEANVSLWVTNGSGKMPQLRGNIQSINSDGKSGADSEVISEVALWLHGYKLVKE